MSRTPSKGYPTLPPSVALRVDQVCNQFEADWKAGPRPRIEDYLGAASEPERLALMCELILLEIEYRRQAQETPHASDYRDRFPTLDPAWLAEAVEPVSAEDGQAAPAKLSQATMDLPAPAADPAPSAKKGSTRSARGEPTSPDSIKRIRCPHCHNPISLVEDRSDEVLCPGCGNSFLIRETQLTTTTSGMKALGKFQLLERVGLGAFGAVWRARDTELDRLVALKIPHTGLLTSPHELERFHREARATAQLRHPGIVTVHEVATLEGLPVIVADFIHGVPLAGLLKLRRLTFREAATLLAEVAEALDYAHVMGAVHRDIKPANIMVEYPRPGMGDDGSSDAQPAGDGKPAAVGKPLVMDFGLAVREGAEVTLTVEGQILGTPAYMSPEQAAGRSHQVDRRSDVYSLGVVLYQLLTGELPFRGSKTMIIHQVLHEEPRRPRKLNDRVPRDLETICLRALAKAPASRYATARALAEDLRFWLNGEPIRARPVGPVERLGRWCRRYPLVAGLLAALVVVFAGGSTGVAWQWTLKEQEKAERQRLVELQSEVQGLLLEGDAAHTQNDLPRAQAQFAQALVLIGSEPRLATLFAPANDRLAETERKLAEVSAQAQRLEREKQARQQVHEFRRLAAEELHFHTVNTNPVAERAPYFDPRKGTAAGQQALAIARTWGPGLDQLPLPPAERTALKQELYELLLLQVQAGSRPAPDAPAVEEMLTLLDQARTLSEPSRSYYRLRSTCYELVDKKPEAAAERIRANDPRLPTTALDHFLRGEDYRTQAAAQADPQTAGAVWHLDRALLEKAIAAYRLALHKQPDHYGSLFQLGRCYLSLGRGAEAVLALSACVALRKDSPWGYSVRGLALGLQNRLPEAMQDLDQALKLDPHFRPAQLNRGVVHWLAKEYDAALADFQAVDKVLIEACYYRGLLNLQRGAYADARDDFNRVVDENPQFWPVYLLRAHVHLVQAQPALCLKDLDAFLTRGRPVDRPEREVHAQRGRLLRGLAAEVPKAAQKRALDLALAELQQAEKLGDPPATVLDDLGAVQQMRGQLKAAIAAYDRAAAVAPEDLRAKVLTKRAWALVDLQKYDEARTDFESAAHLGVNNPKLRLTRAEAYTGVGYVQACRQDTAAAEQAARQALALVQEVDHWLIRYNLACIYGELSRSDAARVAPYQDLAILLLQRTMELARREGAERQPLEMSRKEAAFPEALRQRSEFKELIQETRHR